MPERIKLNEWREGASPPGNSVEAARAMTDAELDSILGRIWNGWLVGSNPAHETGDVRLYRGAYNAIKSLRAGRQPDAAVGGQPSSTVVRCAECGADLTNWPSSAGGHQCAPDAAATADSYISPEQDTAMAAEAARLRAFAGQLNAAVGPEGDVSDAREDVRVWMATDGTTQARALDALIRAARAAEREACVQWLQERGRPVGRLVYDKGRRTILCAPVEGAARAPLADIQTIVDEQAEDEGLWFEAQTAPEAYLQQELRRLHAAIEAHAGAARAQAGTEGA